MSPVLQDVNEAELGTSHLIGRVTRLDQDHLTVRVCSIHYLFQALAMLLLCMRSNEIS